MPAHGSAYTLGQFAEITSAVIRALPKGIGGLDPKRVISAVQNGEALEKQLHTVFCRLTSVAIFKRDMRKEDNWKLLEDWGRNPELTLDTIPNLVHVLFLKKNEGWIGGEELVIRARGDLKANWGQQDAEFLLDNQHLIPESFRDRYIVFTGTIWQGRGGDPIVAFLNWNGSKWHLNFDGLDTDYDSNNALPGLRK